MNFLIHWLVYLEVLVIGYFLYCQILLHLFLFFSFFLVSFFLFFLFFHFPLLDVLTNISSLFSVCWIQLSYIVVDLLIWWGIRGYINDFRKKKLKLPPIAYFSTYHGSISHLPTGYMWSPHVVSKPKGENGFVYTKCKLTCYNMRFIFSHLMFLLSIMTELHGLLDFILDFWPVEKKSMPGQSFCHSIYCMSCSYSSSFWHHLCYMLFGFPLPRLRWLLIRTRI